MAYNIIATPPNLREVTRAEFYASMGPLDVDPIPQGGQDQASIWRLKTGRVVGKTCNVLNEHSRTKYPLEQKYYLL